MAFWESIVSGGVSGVLKGAGEFAVKVREAVTGESVLNAEQKTELIAQTRMLEAMSLQADIQSAANQTQVNVAEAQSGSVFRGGWRPMVGWICAAALGFHFIVAPLLPWFFNLFRTAPLPPIPPLDIESLMTVLLGMLGLGGMRSWEKFKGVTK